MHTIEAATSVFPGYLAPDSTSLAALLPKIPEEIMGVFEEAAQVYPYDDSAGVIRTDREPTPGEHSTIAIDFRGDNRSPHDVVTVQHFIRIVGFSLTEDREQFFVKNSSPATEDELQQFIKYAIRASAVARLFELLENITFAETVGGTLFTPSEVHYSVLDRLDAHGAESREMHAMANVDLPFLSDISTEQIVRARQDSNLFRDFRIGYRNALGKIKADPSDSSFRRELQHVKAEFFDQAPRRLEEELRLLKLQSFVRGALVGGIGVGAAKIGGAALAGPIAAMFAGVAAGAFDNWLGRQKLRNSSAAYFLWKFRTGK